MTGSRAFRGDLRRDVRGVGHLVCIRSPTAALFARFRSRIGNSFGEKLLSTIRKEFDDHIESTIPVHKAKDEDR